MDISLKSSSEIILESDLESRPTIMERQRDYLLKQAKFFKDISIISDAAIETYKLAYQNKIISNQKLADFEFRLTSKLLRNDKSNMIDVTL